MKTDLLDTLKNARDLIAKECSWTQGSLALDCLMRPLEPKDNHAVCWCAAGAIRRVASYEQLVALAEDQLAYAAGIDLMEYNDNYSHEKVIDLFDRVIAKLEENYGA